jgi:large subunit ribosomal protein L16
MYQPKKTKFLKFHKPGLPSQGKLHILTQGISGIMAIQTGSIPGHQLEAARQNINRRLKRKGKIIIHVFPDRGRTEKPCEVRMGKGKGNIKFWQAMVYPGSLIFEIRGISRELIRQALLGGCTKLGVGVKII